MKPPGISSQLVLFFAFTAYNTSMDCISLVCLFTINETTNGIIDIWSIICYIICARQFVVVITSGYFILCVQCDCLVFILRGKEKYRFSVDKVHLLKKNVHNRRIAIIERFLNRLRICQHQVKILFHYYWNLKNYLLYYLCETSRNYYNLWILYPLRSVRLSRFYFTCKEKYRFSVYKVPLLWKNVHNRRIDIIERFFNRLRICQRQVKTLCRYYWHFATYWVNYI